MSDKKRIDFASADADRGECSKCRAPIIWRVMPSGAKMPLSTATKETRDGVDYYESHFSDCPAADSFRRNRIDRGNYG